MTDYDDLLDLAEQNHRNITTLADYHDASDHLVTDVSPRGETETSERVKYLGLDSDFDKSAASDDEAMSDRRRATRLLIQNAENLQRLADATGSEKSKSHTTGETRAKAAAFFGVK